MKNWKQLTEQEQFAILFDLLRNKNIINNAVEKDYWVSMVLRAIFSLPYADSLVFKGGTSLSKGWGLIERFSEDVDLAIDRQYLGFAEIETKRQQSKLRKESKRFIDGTFATDLEHKLKEFGLTEHCHLVVPQTSVSDLDPVAVFVKYHSILKDKNPYIQEWVKVEISCRSLMEPSEMIKMRSIIEDAYPNDEFSWPEFAVPTVIPGRTFLEKIFLLHEEFNRPNGCTHLERITRHIYDVVQMMNQPFANESINNPALYQDIVAHRKQFTAWSGLDYTSHAPHTISFVPPAHIDTQLRNDYQQMQLGFIYANAPSFDEMMAQLKALQDRFRKVEWGK